MARHRLHVGISTILMNGRLMLRRSIIAVIDFGPSIVAEAIVLGCESVMVHTNLRHHGVGTVHVWNCNKATPGRYATQARVM